jgi:hypothetical protein
VSSVTGSEAPMGKNPAEEKRSILDLFRN